MITTLKLNSEQYRVISDLINKITNNLEYNDVLNKWITGDVIYMIDTNDKTTLENLNKELNHYNENNTSMGK